MIQAIESKIRHSLKVEVDKANVKNSDITGWESWWRLSKSDIGFGQTVNYRSWQANHIPTKAIARREM